MFTLEQINAIHDQLGSAESLAQYVKALSALGIETYDSHIMDGHSEYVGKNGQKVISPSTHEMLTITDTSDKETFLKHLDRRYTNYKGGRKYDKEHEYALNEKGTGDPVKAESARIFYEQWKRAEANTEYAARKEEWREQYG